MDADPILYGSRWRRGRNRCAGPIIDQLSCSLDRLRSTTHLLLMLDRGERLTTETDTQQYEMLRLLDMACGQNEAVSLSCAGFSGESFDQAAIFEIQDEHKQLPNRTVFGYQHSTSSSGNHAVALEYADHRLSEDGRPGVVLLVSHGMQGRPDYRTHNLAADLQAQAPLHLLLHPYQKKDADEIGAIPTVSAVRRAYADAGLSSLLDGAPTENSGLADDYWFQVSLAGAISDLAARQK